MFKEFLMKKALERQLKNISEAEKQKVISLIEKNPDFFAKLGQSIQEKMKQGKDQMTAAMEVAQEFKGELAKLQSK